jgi:ATP-dependent DNA helicase RecQ
MLGRSLLHQELLSETNDGYRILKLNKRSWEILRKQRSVEIAVSERVKSESGREYNFTKAEAEILFERLKQLRKQIADLHSVPPYIIFADSSLRLMAQLQPQTLTDFANISGVGNHKLQQYGEQFVSVIREFSQTQKLPTPLPSQSQMATLQLHQQGLNVDEIAQKRNLAVSTINGHLSELIEMNQPVALNRLVQPDKQQIITRAIEKIGADSLKELKEYLGENYSYVEIRLVRAWWRNRQQ